MSKAAVLAAAVAVGAAGTALLVLDLGIVASAAGVLGTGVSGVVLVSLAFYAVGQSEDREREQTERERAERAARRADRPRPSLAPAWRRPPWRRR
jgi:hypothetical protein